jgi:hypothetical protein
MTIQGDFPEELLLNGRLFTRDELNHIREVIRLFPRLSQKELAHTLCETLEWYGPNGKPKLESCRELLRKLEKKGWIRLPEKRHTRSSGKETVTIGSATEAEPELSGNVSAYAPIELEPVRAQQEIRLWNEYVERYHRLGYKRPFGAHQRYWIWSGGTEPKRRLGCLLFAASAWALAERDKWLGWDKKTRSQRLHLIVNNTRFLIFPWVKIKNLASKALAMASRQVVVDWQERYGYAPVLLETFVDTAHYTGTCYRAAGWIDLGLTAGRGRMDRYNERALSPKRIFVYPLKRDFRAQLCSQPESGGERDE